MTDRDDDSDPVESLLERTVERDDIVETIVERPVEGLLESSSDQER
ncbi:hypothetical protein [Natronobacterium gregoryi]|uniref:Uncharacterized protein n=2 Tax=Natronobacterium gregoryi TaxID=44930 RepID=L0AF39_NATGS|nr:hypothetical protein [Natronobacterium gregoryi]AFZ72456.1 hypothetical protein Natgr_1232 [Natronobacterium gregoryi SP2]SFI78184.1 hypothetical protein SAMN05443661_105110 [Natronobacterium gregoryi]